MKRIMKDPFEEYTIESELTKKERSYSWYTAIGLQDVDGLKTSDYLKTVAVDNINGDISFDEAEELVKSYYIENADHSLETEEADKVAINIARTLSERSFIFSPAQYLDIHKKLFYNVFPHAGKIRTYNISKKEWVLNGDTVIYGGASLLKETLEYDFNIEKTFDYSGLNIDESISHLARFIANLWQIHVFSEGNTRTTAVFLIKYLRKFGYDVTNDIFAKNSWYFRNALVRANYTNISNGIFETTSYLKNFLRNLILDEKHELKNRYLHVNWKEKVNIESVKVDIRDKKVDIGDLNVSTTMIKNINNLYDELSQLGYFGRSDVIEVLKLSPSGASKLIKKLLEIGVIIPVNKHGKGKYHFNIKGL